MQYVNVYIAEQIKQNKLFSTFNILYFYKNVK